jgi:L-asparaginase
MQATSSNVVVLGTGGTIAGTAADAGDNLGYTAAQLSVQALLRSVPALVGQAIECEQVAQVDSKDMEFQIWHTLAERVSHHLARPEVAGVVITHGTDTLEETAYVLQRLLAPIKPVVLTAAMRPATSLQADGPQNILDAVVIARHAGARGVVAVLAGLVHSAFDVRKSHTYELDAFSSGDAGPLARIEQAHVRELRAWPAGEPVGFAWPGAGWPRVEIVTSHAGADGAIVDVLVAAGVQGLVVAGTGGGTLHHKLEAALLKAQAAGVRVLRATRVASGPVFSKIDENFPASGLLSPVKARIELILQLLREKN